METDRLRQLTQLRDFLIRNRSQIELSTIENCMADFIQDIGLKKMLMNPIAAEAIAHTLHNNNSSRDQLISELYRLLTVNHNMGGNDTLELIKHALFLGGVDRQPTQISAPQNNRQDHNSGIHNGSNDGNGGCGDQNKNRRSRFIRIGVAVIALIAIVLSIKRCCSDDIHDYSKNLYSATDICHLYDGNIDKDGIKKTYRMSVSILSSNEFKILLTDVYNSNDKTEYVGYIKIDKLILNDGPKLNIKISKNKTNLDSDDKKHGKWNFISIN